LFWRLCRMWYGISFFQYYCSIPKPAPPSI